MNELHKAFKGPLAAFGSYHPLGLPETSSGSDARMPGKLQLAGTQASQGQRYGSQRGLSSELPRSCWGRLLHLPSWHLGSALGLALQHFASEWQFWLVSGWQFRLVSGWQFGLASGWQFGLGPG